MEKLYQFRDYRELHLISMRYDACKKNWHYNVPDDRKSYTEGKRKCNRMTAEEHIYGRQQQIHKETKRRMKEVKNAPYYYSGNLGLIGWLHQFVAGLSGDFNDDRGFIVQVYFLYSAYATWKKEKDGKGGR